MSNMIHPMNGKEKQVTIRVEVLSNDLFQIQEEESVSQSSFLRIYTHGHLSKILPALLFSCLRGFEIPFYSLLMNLIYNALSTHRFILVSRYK